MEGTTQGDPLAMSMYAMGTLPLILRLESNNAIDQIWYADDSAAGGKIPQLCKWWDEIVEQGPAFGYFVNAAKTVLIVKDEHYAETLAHFEDTDIQVTTSSGRYLSKEAFVTMKVEKWKTELEKLTKIAYSQPHAAYCALTHSIKNKWFYLSRTTEGIGPLLQPVEQIIRHQLIPAITGRHAISDAERRLFSLPTR